MTIFFNSTLKSHILKYNPDPDPNFLKPAPGDSDPVPEKNWTGSATIAKSAIFYYA